jgi:hypothetical protein
MAMVLILFIQYKNQTNTQALLMNSMPFNLCPFKNNKLITILIKQINSIDITIIMNNQIQIKNNKKIIIKMKQVFLIFLVNLTHLS